MKGDIGLVLATIQVRDKVVIRNTFENKRELVKAVVGFLEGENIPYNKRDTHLKTVITKTLL